MHIIGNGFLARNLRPIADRHPDTVVLAAGVSWASGTSADDFARERDLLAGTARQCAADGRRLVFFSTSSAGFYGPLDRPAREDVQVTPVTPYGAHKLAQEELLRASGADHLILRLSHLVGPAQPDHQLLPSLVRQLREEDTVRVHRGATRDLIGVADVVHAIDGLLGLGLRGVTVNVASGISSPVGEIVDHLRYRLGSSARTEYVDVGHVHPHTISVEKLHALLPACAVLGFGGGYHRRLLDAYVARPQLVTA
ncbi:NAD-dependent epimerase/dehydratase family protein [Streptacidiphilus anmyonensis]|uniref:NAD-dependent epimerase/dehydratase family protein n=1 Tax=Streptacidiphilus anmyonensis TaxID=405782 RepID=UPI0005A87D96|nr:NAD-dependent epimerase/dehydratase family protein [Streptacidiphilus anmyonensis]